MCQSRQILHKELHVNRFKKWANGSSHRPYWRYIKLFRPFLCYVKKNRATTMPDFHNSKFLTSYNCFTLQNINQAPVKLWK